MKGSIIGIISLIVLGSAMYGQGSYVDEYEQIQAIRSHEKRVVLAEFIELKETAADVFWSVYEEYEQIRLLMGRNRLEFLRIYTLTYMNMSDEKTDEVMKQMIEVRKSYHKLIDKYYKKVRSQAGAKAAAQFYQVEYYFMNLSRISVMNNMPFFGEDPQTSSESPE